MNDSKFDVVIVGAGPAGIAAACSAAECGRSVVLIDETPWPGGQIWRGRQTSSRPKVATQWIDRLHNSGATVLDQTTVIGSAGPGLLLAESKGRPCRVRWDKLIVATGARELFLPFPGWTLPGVTGAGGLLNLVKNGWPVAGKRVVIAGSGPLLLAAADGLLKHGAIIVEVAEQTSWSCVARFGVGLCRRPGKFFQAVNLKFTMRNVPCTYESWPVRADGSEKLQHVTLTNGQRTWHHDCDFLACAFGLVPNIELALCLGCEIKNGFVDVDARQQTGVKDIYCAGEVTGIAGADGALVEGQIAGYCAAGADHRAEALAGKRRSWHRFGSDLAKAFALRPELRVLAEDQTIVCRCEDVALGCLKTFSNWREAKLHSRCGMGPCQGRVCGPAVKEIFGWELESVRPPISPARVASLIAED
ncbi:MAG TPA: FAD/NAD(P)-binding oxidoreductase [Verrucomicrobiae bacterium]|jgi:NADPH-dependent 2,4-dienoyl-CoA reductase/sulfur reductase-like enzyme|nr:FAD/NAD(P)-binding oxidoreductase [Verrucomicrobiae bacterium]